MMSKMLLASAVVALLSVAGLPGNASGRAGKSPAASILFETPITFHVTDRDVFCPMVEVSIRGKMTKLILDTGSTDHVLTIEMANKVGLKSEPAEPGTDHAGEPVPSWSLGEVAIQMEGKELLLRKAQAIKGPAPFEGWGVGGFLSPQNLHASAFTVIDLVGNRLFLVDGNSHELAAWLKARYPTLHMLKLKRSPGKTALVRASIEPFAAVVTMLNTGGRQTEFARSSVPTLRGANPDTLGAGVSGTQVTGEEVKGQMLRVGDARLPVPALLVRGTMKPPFGLVGMDCLRGTVLAISASANEPAYWLVPASFADPRNH